MAVIYLVSSSTVDMLIWVSTYKIDLVLISCMDSKLASNFLYLAQTANLQLSFLISRFLSISDYFAKYLFISKFTFCFVSLLFPIRFAPFCADVCCSPGFSACSWQMNLSFLLCIYKESLLLQAMTVSLSLPLNTAIDTLSHK